MGNTNAKFDPYIVLDLDRSATMEEISKNYKQKARIYHPDRIKKHLETPESLKMKEDKYKEICVAYDILSDPEKRREYNSNHVPSHKELQNDARDFMKQQKNVKPSYDPSKFELDSFNKQFKENKAPDPNDHGYEFKRLMESDITPSGKRRQEDIPAPPKIMDSFDNQRFNQIFEHFHQGSNGTDIMEHEDGPMGFSLAPQSNYTDIAIYDGKMLYGMDTNNYTETGKYTDYMQSFSGYDNTKIGSTNDIDFKSYQGKDSAMSNQEMQRRLREKQNETIVFDTRSKGEAERELLKKHEEQLKREAEIHKQQVLKYKDQFNTDLLPPPR